MTDAMKSPMEISRIYGHLLRPTPETTIMDDKERVDQIQSENYQCFDEFEGLIFDCDGTLADTMPVHFVAWQRTLDAINVRFPEARFYAMAGQPTVKIVAQLLEEQGINGDPIQISKSKELAFLENLDRIQPIIPVVGIAKAYLGKRSMGVGSGSNRQVVLELLNQLDIRELFTGIVGAEDTQRHKPEPDVFLEVARRIGVKPEKCIVFEDADLGIESARRAGMACFDVRLVHQPRRVHPA